MATKDNVKEESWGEKGHSVKKDDGTNQSQMENFSKRDRLMGINLYKNWIELIYWAITKKLHSGKDLEGMFYNEKLLDIKANVGRVSW